MSMRSEGTTDENPADKFLTGFGQSSTSAMVCRCRCPAFSDTLTLNYQHQQLAPKSVESDQEVAYMGKVGRVDETGIKTHTHHPCTFVPDDSESTLLASRSIPHEENI